MNQGLLHGAVATHLCGMGVSNRTIFPFQAPYPAIIQNEKSQSLDLKGAFKSP
jgi:hypothetical protein